MIIGSWLIVMIIYYLSKWFLLLVCNHPNKIKPYWYSTSVDHNLCCFGVFIIIWELVWKWGCKGMGVYHGVCWAKGRMKKIKILNMRVQSFTNSFFSHWPFLFKKSGAHLIPSIIKEKCGLLFILYVI